jgi:hypothetical protein
VAGKEQIMTAVYDMDPSTSTIVTAWASSEFGDPETGPTEFWEATNTDEAADRKPKSIARHAGLVAALAGVFGAGAAFGLAVFDFADWASPTITLPYVSTQADVPPGPTQVAPSAAASAPATLPPKPGVAAPDNATAPQPPGSVPAGGAPTLADKPGPIDVVSPPANSPGDSKVTVDIALPPPPDAVPVPDEPEPEPANPKPTLQLAPEIGPTDLQPAQPPTLKKPRTALNDAFSPGSERRAGQSTKPSPRTKLAKP